jgi:hypothetical protein
VKQPVRPVSIADETGPTRYCVQSSTEAGCHSAAADAGLTARARVAAFNGKPGPWFFTEMAGHRQAQPGLLPQSPCFPSSDAPERFYSGQSLPGYRESSRVNHLARAGTFQPRCLDAREFYDGAWSVIWPPARRIGWAEPCRQPLIPILADTVGETPRRPLSSSSGSPSRPARLSGPTVLSGRVLSWKR